MTRDANDDPGRALNSRFPPPGAAETLTAAEKVRLERQRVSARGFTRYQLSPDGSKLLVVLSGKLYVVERASKKVLQLKTGEGACIDPKFSPAGTHVGYVRANDLISPPTKNCASLRAEPRSNPMGSLNSSPKKK